MSDNQQLASLVLGAAFIGSIMYIDKIVSETKMEKFSEMAPTMPPTMAPQTSRRPQIPPYPQNPKFYGGPDYTSNGPFAGPDGFVPQDKINVNLNTSGSQLLAYQLYQQAVNAATPTSQQLASISGDSQMQTGVTAEQLKGGLSSDYAPYNVLSDKGPQLFASEYQAVNLGNQRADSIGACAQNAPTFIATPLLPKPTVPGQESWDIGAPQNILANQNFLSATQQVGVDTVLSSLRNPSYDIRGDIPNPINTVSPWMNSTITPDLERRPLITFIADQGLYSDPNGCNQNGTFVNM